MLNTFENDLHSFFGELKRGIEYNYTITVSLNILSPKINKSGKCIAIVNNLDGRTYQCTRRQKCDGYCGLHLKDKSKYKTIFSDSKYNKITKLYNLKLKNGNNSIDREYTYIKWKKIYYILHRYSGKVYYNDLYNNEKVFMGTLDSLKINL